MATPFSILKLMFVVTCLIVHVSLSFADFSIVGYSQDDLTSIEKSIRLFESWMLKHDKVYKSIEEKINRFEIFKDNLVYIDETNKKNNSYWLRLNEFADLTYDEFREKYVGSVPEDYTIMEQSDDGEFPYKHVVDYPESVDWRQKGAVTPVKKQSSGDSWAFSTVASVEGINKIVTGKLISLSEQELIDCIRRSVGCVRGYQMISLRYVVKNGVHTEYEYPYEKEQCICRAEYMVDLKVQITGYKRVPPNDEISLIKVIANQPVSVLVDSSERTFRFYGGGIYTGPCPTNLDHAVTAIGYGKNYIIIKNSWGLGWGERGYMRIKRTSKKPEGMCGVYISSYFPIKGYQD